jgi:ElaB/YqjD/DUF883 family membrane-anchored ribosome-binding protein
MATQRFDQGSVGPRGRGRTTGTEGAEETSRSSTIERGQKSSERATQSASTITSQVQGLLDQQVVKGAKVVSNVANSARRAADELEADTPQLAGLVRGMADRMQEYSRNLEDQSVTDIYRSASDFTRRQPAIVFGLAALAGFFALRTFKSASETGTARSGRTNYVTSGEFHGS